MLKTDDGAFGIEVPRERSGDAALNEAADTLWARFAETRDADQLTDFSGLQALIVRATAESGECLARIRERASSRETGSMTGVAASRMARVCRLTRLYLAMSGGITGCSGMPPTRW